jgi:hypothetical protein
MSRQGRDRLDLDDVGGSLRDHLDETLRAPLPSRMQILLAQLRSTAPGPSGGPAVPPHRPTIAAEPVALVEATVRSPRRYSIRSDVPRRSHVKRWVIDR